MKYKRQVTIILLLVTIIAISNCTKVEHSRNAEDNSAAISNKAINNNKSLIEQGKQVFRFDAFGDEDFWSGLLHIDKAIAGSANGGFGSGVSPVTALSVGLKVDADALPPAVVSGISSGAINLNDPATTLELLKLNAVVGVKGNFNQSGALQSIGITCASCHSTVDNSFAPGIGKRLDAWPNRD